MPLAETFAGNQWPAEQFDAVMTLAINFERRDQPLRSPVYVRGLMLRDMLKNITPAGNA